MKIEELSNEEMCQMGIEMQNQIKRNYDNPAMMEIYAEELIDINNIVTKSDYELVQMLLQYNNEDCNLHNTWDEQERRFNICEKELLSRLTLSPEEELEQEQAYSKQVRKWQDIAVDEFRKKLVKEINKNIIVIKQDDDRFTDLEVIQVKDIIDLINKI